MYIPPNTLLSSPTFIDLFAGAGGFTLGLVEAGLSPIFAVENDFSAASTYNANFGNHCENINIESIQEFPNADIVVGGPPCQGFSNLGKNDPSDPRNTLWLQFLRVVEAVNPKIFVIENVPPLLKSDQGKHLIQKASVELNYHVRSFILNAADYGVPQTRKRAIIIGSRIGEIASPLPTHENPELPLNKKQGLKPWRTVQDAIGDLPRVPTEESLHWGRNPTETSLLRYQHIPIGGNRFDLPLELTPDCWKRKTKGGTDLFGRLWWNRPSVTIRTEFFKPEKGRYLHPEEHRPITHREAARLQEFPDDFLFEGSKISIARQIGNAVPVGLGEAIGKTILEMIESSKSEAGSLLYALPE